jgi:hypothetical protein
MTDRARYAAEAFRSFPKLLGLVDRNRLSPTYGCFDRNHWHYKAIDFPSGMAETGVLPLALAHVHALPGGERYHGQPRLRELALAGIRFAAAASHADGACDDYFPFERALGATSFSLYALTEAALVLGVRDADVLEFLARRGRWLLAHDESGRLSNHQALAGLALLNVALLTGDDAFRVGAARRVDRALGWQSAEGWFREYEGADPGYQSATIDFLAKYWLKSGDDRLLGPLGRAVGFASHFLHPDGSYGGGYGSRNLYHFFPAGFEILAPRLPEAGSVAAGFLAGLAQGRRAHADDDRIFFHWVWDFLQAALHHDRRDGAAAPLPNRSRHFREAGLYVRDEPHRYTVIGLAKGGVIAVFEDARRRYSDHGLIGRLADGRVVVTQMIDAYRTEVGEAQVSVEGTFGYVSRLRPTPARLILFRLVTLTVGRLAADLVRRLLQRLLIVGKRPAPLRFRRTVRFGPRVALVDEVWYPGRRRPRLDALWAGTDHTAIYVAMSQGFHESCLQPWTDLGPALPQLAATGRLRVERVLD